MHKKSFPILVKFTHWWKLSKRILLVLSFVALLLVVKKFQSYHSIEGGYCLKFKKVSDNGSINQCYASCEPCETTDQTNNCHSPPVHISDDNVTQEKLSKMSHAAATLPCILTLKQSHIPQAGAGVFARYKIPKGFVFGPYRGRIVKFHPTKIRGTWTNDNESGVQLLTKQHWLYAWGGVFKYDNFEEYVLLVDGMDETISNWMRWVNSARFYEEQNVVRVAHQENVFYLIFKDIYIDQELLIWYGSQYAVEVLKISLVDRTNQTWNETYAPFKNTVTCPTCAEHH